MCFVNSYYSLGTVVQSVNHTAVVEQGRGREVGGRLTVSR